MMKPPFPVCLTAIAAGMTMAAAQAQSTPPNSLERVEVSGTAERNYLATEASSATRLPAPLKETPVTVQSVDAELLRDRALRNPNALADLVAGVQPIVGYGSSTSQYFNIRGFSNAGVNYRNGFRIAEVYTPRDLANVERVEFVKGPASVLYGAAQPGGAVNTVTKQPEARDFTRLDMSWDRFDTGRIAVDANRASGAWAVRLNLAVDQGQTWIDLEHNRNVLIAPVLRWQAGPDLSVIYEGEFQRTERRGWSNGLLAVPGLADLPFSTTLSEPWTWLNNTNVSHRLEFKQQLGGGLQFRQALLTSYAKRGHASISPAFSADPLADGNSISAHGRVAYAQVSDNPANDASQTELSGRWQSGGFTHQWLAGLELQRSVFSYSGIYNSLDSVDLRTFKPGATPPYAISDDSGSRREGRTVALYLQDQIAMGDWRLLAGLRQERVRSSSRELPASATSGSDSQTETATTARLGALYLINPGTSVYYSFSQSFSPNLGGRSQGGSLFKAERGTQHEIGLKATLAPGLEATVALFDIRKRNVLTGDPANPTQSITNGEQRSRGAEVSLAGRLSPTLKLIANASSLDAKVSRDTDPGQLNQKLVGVARQSGNAWALWNPAPGWDLGLGAVRVGEREAAQPGLAYFKLPAYSRFDALLATRFEGWRLALNVDNLSNRKILNTLEGYAVLIESPRRWTLSASTAF
jgi:iron complex outermembrane receptor protein